MKLFWTVILTVTSLHAHALNLKVSTFNIRWFGLGGIMEGTLNDEKRGQNLQDFIKNASKISQSDVIALEEIVDRDKIETFFPDHTCTSYDHPVEKHQHVMICVKKPMKLVLDGGDNNFIWEDVGSISIDGNTSRLRPPVHGVIQDAKGVNLAHVVAVHLKADPEQSVVRMQQIQLIKNHMEKDYKDKLPLLITGDFNTHVAKSTGQKKDDYLMMSDIFSTGLKPITHVTNLETTFRSGKTYNTLDHYWISNDLKSTVPAVWPECKKGAAGAANTFLNPQFYYDEVSDHCPITVEVSTRS